MDTVRRYFWIAGLVFGLTFLALGGIFVVKGIDAKDTIREALADEEVVTSGDASIPGVPVLDAETAQSQADVVKAHSLERYGTYSSMGRDDPNRDVYIKGLTLRNSLGLAVLGFGVADLAIGTGALLLLLGIATLGFGVPVLVWLRVPGPERASRAALRGAPVLGPAA